ncbi:MAG: hypothetical protein CR975_02040 [Gammaproteobacteria bacterium]|nr:MAG: hypothetical protein CR975_02040 [Gammaproteobacteria bacterium]
MSLCKKHFARISASLSQSDDGLRDNLDAYEMMLVQLHDDVLRIKSVKSTEGKNRIKAEILPNYVAWCDGVIDQLTKTAGQSARQDDVFAQAFVWTVDVLDLPRVAEMFAAIQVANMRLPERFKREPADFMLEQIAEAVIAGKHLPLAELQRLENACAGIDMHNEIRAKWCKAMGLLLESQDDASSWQMAIDYFKQALQLNDKVGVKKRLNQLQSKLKKAAD